MQEYLNLLDRIVRRGAIKGDRTGVGTISLFGEQIRFDLHKGFPLLTTKKIPFKVIAHELLFFISGNTNIQYLHDRGVTIWDSWAPPSGDLGPIYSAQWRAWQCMIYDEQVGGYTFAVKDQLKDAITLILTNPDSRRIVVSAWNLADLDKMALPPCHALFQFYVNDGVLSCHMYQRSADIFLGVPFNIASYALLTCMVAHVCDLTPGDLIISFGDVHLYRNHYEQACTQLARSPGRLPLLRINPRSRDLFAMTVDDFTILDYQPQPHIAAEVAV